MTKKRFFKLRQALVTELHKQAKARGDNPEQLHKGAKSINRMPQPDLAKCGGSYATAWEQLKPLRDALNFQ